MSAQQLGPWLFVAIGGAWVRVDQIAAVTDWEVIMIGTGAAVPLGDDVVAGDVLDRIAAHVKRLDAAPAEHGALR